MVRGRKIALRERPQNPMAGLFGDFDFTLLDDPEFGEDAVREELVVPLLAALGYTASPPDRIIRSRKLEHPFVLFGTVRKGITIIPDYLLERDGASRGFSTPRVPERTSTPERMSSGPTTPTRCTATFGCLFTAVNGCKLVVFHVTLAAPVIDVPLQEIDGIWPMVLDILGCRSAWAGGLPLGFNPDMGLALGNAGLVEDAEGKKYYHVFTSVPVRYVGRVEDGLYSITGLYVQEELAHMLTFDFGPDVYPAFLAELEDDERERVRTALSRQPYKFVFAPGKNP